MGAAEVKYGDFPIIEPLTNHDNEAINSTFLPFFLSKAPFWNYELEYRFLDYPCLKRKKLMNNSLDSIYMGCNISSENEIWVKDFCKSYGNQIRLYKAEKIYFKYEIEFNEVSY